MMKLVSEEALSGFIPHRPPFVQVGCLIEAGETLLVTQFTVRPDNVLVRDGFFLESGLLENIAQSVALGFGYRGKKDGLEPEVGYIGAISRVEVFRLPEVGASLTTRVKITHRMDPVVMVHGTCYLGDEKLLEGEIKLVIRK